MAENGFEKVGKEKTIVSENSTSYKNICGKGAAGNTGIVDKFSKEIGCQNVFGPGVRSMIKRDATYRAKFQKAKKCVGRRLTRMGEYNAANNATRKKRSGHAHAVRVAYAYGKNCLQKLDMPSNLYSASTDELISKMDTKKPGVRKAITGANSGVTINNAINANEALSSILEPIEITEENLAAATVASAKMGAAAAAPPASASAAAGAATGSAAAIVPKTKGPATKAAKKGKKGAAASGADAAADNNFNLLEPAFPFKISDVEPIHFKSVYSLVMFFKFKTPAMAIAEYKSDELFFNDYLMVLIFTFTGLLIRYLKTNRAYIAVSAYTKIAGGKVSERLVSILESERDTLKTLLDDLKTIKDKCLTQLKVFKPQMAEFLESFGKPFEKRIQEDFVKAKGKITWKNYFPQLDTDDLDPELEELMKA